VRHPNDLLGVTLPWATFGLVFDPRGVCTEAPPIARWCEGKRAIYLIDYWQKRGARTRWI